jgi:hypothetical protein
VLKNTIAVITVINRTISVRKVTLIPHPVKRFIKNINKAAKYVTV